jgi:hypothetical protein
MDAVTLDLARLVETNPIVANELFRRYVAGKTTPPARGSGFAMSLFHQVEQDDHV